MTERNTSDSDKRRVQKNERRDTTEVPTISRRFLRRFFCGAGTKGGAEGCRAVAEAVRQRLAGRFCRQPTLPRTTALSTLLYTVVGTYNNNNGCVVRTYNAPEEVGCDE